MKEYKFLGIAALALGGASALAQTFGPAGAYFVEDWVSAGLSDPTTMVFIGEGTALVFEKSSGVVRVVENGTVTGSAIDLPVNSSSERGGLGICISPNFSSDHHVFLYYSHANTQGGTWTDNRVERFVYDPGTHTLAFDMSIISFPSDGSQSNGPNHDGGIIMIGPDQKLYIITGDLNRGRFSNPRIEQNTSTSAVAGVGGIIRLNLDGTIPPDNPFFSDPNATIRRYWAYGIRNSFGMTFDPETNYIWYTENGPLVYDEVNVVPTGGMNSGWLKIMGPDSRNAVYSENGNTSYNANQLTMLSGAYYRDPEFSYLSTIAPTSILFMTTDKVRTEEHNQVLVADNNTGSIYMYEMNGNRDGFVLSGGVADKVADSSAERNLNRIGSSWGVTTDLEIGPDGYIYAVDYLSNRIRRIRPTLEHLGPNSLNVIRGNIQSGGLASLQSSDDGRLVMTPGVTLSSSQDPIEFDVTTTSPFASPVSIEIRVEGQASATALRQKIQIEKDNGTWEQLSSANMTTGDSVVSVTLNANILDYIRNDGTIRLRLGYRQTGPVLGFPPQIRIDQIQWNIQR